MKLAWLKNRRGRRGSPRLSLFPFLAVLICTMGALVLLFLAVTRQARLQAAREAAAKFSLRQNDLKAEREAAQWRVEQLRTTRQTTQSQLSDMRLTLGHFEEHSQRLRTRLAQLQAAVKKLGDTEAAAATQQSGGTQEELRDLQAKIAEAERQLNEARQAVQSRPKSYAVVPYEGPNQTRRRPIYLECRPDAIILQPEGIRFTDSDFPEIARGELDEGNPLAVGLRAAEQFLAQSGLDAQHGGQPYPLLLVRPSGGVAYAMAVKALKSWGSEIGYQLVDEDWKLAYPPPDPRLAEVVQQALVTARARLPEVARLGQLRAAAAARAKQGSYRVSPGGGIVRVSDGGDDGDFRPAESNGRYGQRRGGGGYGGSARDGGDEQRSGSGGGTMLGESPAPRLPYAAALEAGAGSSPGVAGGGAPYVPGNGAAGVPAGGNVVAPGTPANAVGEYRPQPSERASANFAGSAPLRESGSPQPTEGMSGRANSVGGGNPQGQPRQTGTRIERPEGYVTGRPYEPQPDLRPAPQNTEGTTYTPLRPGEWHPSEEYAPPPKPDKDRDDKQRRKEVKALAEKRGRDWGLRDAASGSVPNTRPIRVECLVDRLVIVPDDPRGSPVNKIIPLTDRTEASIDKFMAAVWEHMDSWGIAGRGMYWRPILSVRVAPGAEQRFEEFNTLLEGSGLTVRRRQ